MRADDGTLDGAETAAPGMEVTFVETKKILKGIGTLVIVGAASTAGAALWTNVLDYKIKMAKTKMTHSDKVIVVDFKKAKKKSRR